MNSREAIFIIVSILFSVLGMVTAYRIGIFAKPVNRSKSKVGDVVSTKEEITRLMDEIAVERQRETEKLMELLEEFWSES